MVRRVLEDGIALTKTAEAAGVSARTAGKWVRRYRAEGEAGLLDRSSALHRVHNATPADRVETIAALRRLRLTGPDRRDLGDSDLDRLGVLKRIGLGKLSCLRPVELIHIDVKKLGRIGPHGAGHRVLGRSWAKEGTRRNDAAGVPRSQTGWERVHVCVDDATLLPLPRHHGREVDDRQRLRLCIHRSRDRLQDARHQAPPHPPLPTPDQWQGRALHIRTMLREWAYAAVYGSSTERATALSGWIERYSFRRRHGALGHRPPIARLRELAGTT
jgi:hypothetical protein